MKKKYHNDEIDIYYLIRNFWENKNKIIIITTTFLILGFLYHYSLEKSFLAKTNIKPISTFESDKYILYNFLSFGTEETENTEETEETEETENYKFKFNQDTLLNLFISKIQTEELIEKGIKKFQLVNKDNFEKEADYNQEVKRTAISIIDRLTPPLKDAQVYNDKQNKTYQLSFWQFNYQIKDVTNWISFLEFVEKTANDEIRMNLIDRFNEEIKILDINLKFKLEDIEQRIKNKLDDYKLKTFSKIEFLKEQAEIARTLGIKANTLEVENFRTDITAIITNIEPQNSYYLKGYQMIEKEISLIKSRKNEKAFISNLIELERKKRSILQDKSIERMKLLFSETPINNKNNFMAAKIDYEATSYEPQNSLLITLANSFIFGLLISLIYIFFNRIITTRK